MAFVDLHSHSTASDGALEPADVAREAARVGLSHWGLTDHDTLGGLEEAAAEAGRLGVAFVPGLELSSEHDGQTSDILGYFVDPAHGPLVAFLARTHGERDRRAEKIAAALTGLGAPIDLDRLRARTPHGLITRPHVAHALVEAGFVADSREAFRRYLAAGRPAYVPREKLRPEEACQVIRQAGGVPVLAHPVPPYRLWADPKGLLAFLPGLRDAGLGGLECHYPGYAAKTRRWLATLADHFGLVPTGGSDFHGPWRPDSPLGCVTTVPADTVDRLLAARG